MSRCFIFALAFEGGKKATSAVVGETTMPQAGHVLWRELNVVPQRLHFRLAGMVSPLRQPQRGHWLFLLTVYTADDERAFTLDFDITPSSRL